MGDYLESVESYGWTERRMQRAALEKVEEVREEMGDYLECDCVNTDSVGTGGRILHRLCGRGACELDDALEVLGKTLRINTCPADDYEDENGNPKEETKENRESGDEAKSTEQMFRRITSLFWQVENKSPHKIQRKVAEDVLTILENACAEAQEAKAV